MDELGVRQLNRAALARQLLLERADLPVERAVHALAGLQGQAPNAPYVALWSRLRDFHPAELAKGLLERRLVRTPLMRATIHLVTSADAVAWYPVVRPVMERGFMSNFARRLPGVDFTELIADCERLLSEPHTRAALGVALATRWTEQDKTAMAYAATYLLPVVQVPPRGVWGESGQATWTNTATWLGDVGEPEKSPDRMIMRYLAAFGPATVADIQTWCGLTRLKEVVERLPLRRYSGGHYDIEDATLPDPDTPAPPRFLAEYDNLLLSYADRTRVGAHQITVPLPPGIGGVAGTLLVDGFWVATWELRRDGADARLVIEPFTKLTRRDKADVTEEGMRLLGFIADGAARHDVVFEQR